MVVTVFPALSVFVLRDRNRMSRFANLRKRCRNFFAWMEILIIDIVLVANPFNIPYETYVVYDSYYE